MSAVIEQTPKSTVRTSKPRFQWRAFGRWLINAEAVLVFLFIYLPILILIVFSFNASRYVSSWDGFTLDWYRAIVIGESGGELLNAAQTGRGFPTDQLISALGNSLFVAFMSTVISTTLGTMAAIAMERYRFKLQGAVDIMLYLPIVIPEITMGISLLLFFNLLADVVNVRSLLGFAAIIIGHVAFNISFVAIIVRARLAGIDRSLEEAAQDSGANEWETFKRVVLPLIMPGVIGGALLAFTLSLDEYVITSLTAGPGTTTLPVFVYSYVRFGVSPAINALSSMLLVFSIVMVSGSLLLQRR